MADIRVTIGSRSREPGTRVGVQLNTFGLKRLEAGINGEALAGITLEAAQPMLEQALSDWPVWTGASRDSLELTVEEVSAHLARIRLQAGGQRLIEDARNEKHIDYAPYIEFNGTKTAPPGILAYAVHSQAAEFRAKVHAGVSALIAEMGFGR